MMQYALKTSKACMYFFNLSMRVNAYACMHVYLCVCVVCMMQCALGNKAGYICVYAYVCRYVYVCMYICM